MHYVISDIHNDSLKFSEMLRKIRFTNYDQLYILGDLFDRSNKNPDPLDVYFNVLKLGDAWCTCKTALGRSTNWELGSNV